VTRAKRNLCVRVLESRPIIKTTGLRSDQSILSRAPMHPRLSDALRRISFVDPATHKRLIFLPTISAWRPRLSQNSTNAAGKWNSFSMDKQYLRIKPFTHLRERRQNPNLDCDLGLRMIAILKKRKLHLDQSLANSAKF